MNLELRRRGDFRDADDLSDWEFNHVYLDAMSGSCELDDVHLEGMSESDEFNDEYLEAMSESLKSMNNRYRYMSRPKPPIEQHIPQPPIDQKIKPIFLHSHRYNPHSSSWAIFGYSDRVLKPGDNLKIASWNLFFSDHALTARTSAAIANLRTMFGQAPQNLVVMFQEVRLESLQIILGDQWVQQNFVLSDTKPPCLQYANNQSFDQRPDCKPSDYFTLIMSSRDLPISNCFRVPFVSKQERDALVVDIPVFEDPGTERSKRSLRLCTAHLESLWGEELRFRQLVQVSALLKGDLSQGRIIYGGLVGGDMNAYDRSEDDNHRAPEVDLKDVWEDEPAPKPQVLKPFRKDLTFGKAKGHTWGYHSVKYKKRTRLDKFFYTGSIKTFALGEAQDTTGNLGRFGMGLKTKVGSDDVWVSDHFGIAVGITVV